MGPSIFFFRRTWKALNGQKQGFFLGGGSSLIKGRNFCLPYFGFMFEGGPWIFFKDRTGLPEKHECYQVRVWKFFCKNIFSYYPPTLRLNYDWSLSSSDKSVEKFFRFFSRILACSFYWSRLWANKLLCCK